MWDREYYHYPWPTPDLTKIFRSFHLSHLKEALDSVPVVQKVVFIQVNQTYEENGECRFARNKSHTDDSSHFFHVYVADCTYMLMYYKHRQAEAQATAK